MPKMIKYLVPLLFISVAFAQDHRVVTNTLESINNINSDDSTIDLSVHEYVSLKDHKIYDIEIILFAYQKQLPIINIYTNEPIIDDSQAKVLQLKPEELSFIQNNNDPETQSNDTQTNTNDSVKTTMDYTVKIGEEKEDEKALAWFKHDESFLKLRPIWKRLMNQANIRPLIHTAWRQPETLFDNPIYVKLTTEVIENIPISNPNVSNDNNYSILSDSITHQNEVKSSITHPYSDYSINGMVALSQGRFLHFGHKLNLFRQINNNQALTETPIELNDKESNPNEYLVFLLDETRLLKTDELHYFDSPWIGSIIKITEYLGEQEHEDH